MAETKNQWTFVHYKIPREDKGKLEEYIEACKGDVDSTISDLCGQGYKLSLSWVDDKSSYVCTITPKDGVKKNVRSSLPSWSDDWKEAVFMCGYKNEVLCNNGDWTPLLDKDDSWG